MAGKYEDVDGSSGDGSRSKKHPIPKVERAHKRLDTHDKRITRLESARLQAQGALKIIALILGAGGLTYLINAL